MIHDYPHRNDYGNFIETLQHRHSVRTYGLPERKSFYKTRTARRHMKKRIRLLNRGKIRHNVPTQIDHRAKIKNKWGKRTRRGSRWNLFRLYHRNRTWLERITRFYQDVDTGMGNYDTDGSYLLNPYYATESAEPGVCDWWEKIHEVRHSWITEELEFLLKEKGAELRLQPTRLAFPSELHATVFLMKV